ncbi:unnamed protein product, partial [Discosporangium mesarthrocarpum]
MTFLGALLALVLPRSAWRIIHLPRPLSPSQRRRLLGPLARWEETATGEATESGQDHNASGGEEVKVCESEGIHSRGSGAGTRTGERVVRERAGAKGDGSGQAEDEEGRSGGSPNSGGPGGQEPEWALNLSLTWEGAVLEDVELQQDLLGSVLGLPIDLPYAHIRKATLHVPWYTLFLGAFVAKLEGVTIVMCGDAGGATSNNNRSSSSSNNGELEAQAKKEGQEGQEGSAGIGTGTGTENGEGTIVPGSTEGDNMPRRQGGTNKPLPGWLKWALRRLKVQLMDVTMRYESEGMCPLQGAPAAGMEVMLGSLEVQPISLKGSSPWFKRQCSGRQHHYLLKEELIVRGLSLTVEPLEPQDPPCGAYPQSTTATAAFSRPGAPNFGPCANSRATSSGEREQPSYLYPVPSGSSRVFLVEPVDARAQAYVVSAPPPCWGGRGSRGRGGGGLEGLARVMAISLALDARRTPPAGLLLHLPDVLKSWAQGDSVSAADLPVTINATDYALNLAWGVLEEVLRLVELAQGDKAGAGVGDGPQAITLRYASQS